MFRFIVLRLGTLVRLLRARRSRLLENLALRRQLAVLMRRHPKPRTGLLDKLFWVAVRRFWFGWKQSLIVVTPETVVRWHRAGFRLYWRLISRARTQVGRRQTSPEVRELIFRMVVENPTWGAPRIHGELLMLGFDLSERTISGWMKRAPRDPEPAKRWLAFLRNHREAIAAMDFFAAPTITFGVLYCFFVISHDRRRILHFNVTKHPTSIWIIQQLWEAFPFESASRFLIFDRDAKYGLEVPVAVRSLKMSPVRTSFESPWQKGVAERWIESSRRDWLDRIIAVNERHLKRLLSEYVRYYHEDRTHLGLGKGTPNCRTRSRASGRVLSQERLDGFHHRYDRAA
ncbi:MAG: integrase core domain-containing protein [Acidobacteriia bacterium]|nr:integrase core domain-containing protein [Terriglobia bacterium]